MAISVNIESQKIIFGKNVLGPIFYDFCQKLFLCQRAYGPETPCFFIHRGGVRLQYLYNLFIERRKTKAPLRQTPFLSSRIAVIKGTVFRTFDMAQKIVMEAYKGYSNEQFAEYFFQGLEIDIPFSEKKAMFEYDWFKNLIYGDDLWSLPAREFLKEQESILSDYIDALSAGAPIIILVDTGWHGTIQSFLMKAFPDIQWKGLYFGKWSNNRKISPHTNSMIGLCLDSRKIASTRRETALLDYHHLIEGPLEPDYPSVEHLLREEGGNITSYPFVDYDKIPPADNEYFFKGICEFIADRSYYSGIHAQREIDSAKRKLWRMIRYPRPKDIAVMLVEPRSADFGRKRKVSVLAPKKYRNIRARIRKTLWQQGEIVNTFPVIYPIVLLLYYFKRWVSGFFIWERH